MLSTFIIFSIVFATVIIGLIASNPSDSQWAKSLTDEELTSHLQRTAGLLLACEGTDHRGIPKPLFDRHQLLLSEAMRRGLL